ncbi:MAG: hypothetical protein ABIX37_10215, partial [Gammaproteobacteria bacterium]
MRRIMVSLLLVATFQFALPPATAQFWDPRALDGDPATATAPLAPRLSGLGNLAHPITTTKNPESQAFFAQGM